MSCLNSSTMTNSTSQHYSHHTHHSSLISHASHLQPIHPHHLRGMETNANSMSLHSQQQHYSHPGFLHSNQELDLQNNNNFTSELSAYIPFMGGESSSSCHWNSSSSNLYSPTMLTAAAATTSVSSNDLQDSQASCSTMQMCYGNSQSHYTTIGMSPQEQHPSISPASSVTPSWSVSTPISSNSAKKNSTQLYNSMPKSPQQQQYKWMQVKRVIAKPICRFFKFFFRIYQKF